MSRDTNGKDAFDLEKEFEEELKKEKRPEESFLPEEAEFEKGYEAEMKGKEPPKRKELDPFAEKFYELSTRKFKSETDLDNAINAVLNEIERECFFKGLLAKTSKGGKLLLKKGVAMFEGLPAFQAANAVTQLARGNLDSKQRLGLKSQEFGGIVVKDDLGTIGRPRGPVAESILSSQGHEVGRSRVVRVWSWRAAGRNCPERGLTRHDNQKKPCGNVSA